MVVMPVIPEGPGVAKTIKRERGTLESGLLPGRTVTLVKNNYLQEVQKTKNKNHFRTWANKTKRCRFSQVHKQEGELWKPIFFWAWEMPLCGEVRKLLSAGWLLLSPRKLLSARVVTFFSEKLLFFWLLLFRTRKTH